MKKRNIILIGFMGGGKTTIGKRLAERTGYTFVDTDELIVKEQGRSINDIFETEGEPYFRDLETALIERMLDTEDGLIIAVGGGLPVREQNQRILKELGTVLYLEASADVLTERLKHATDRPLLNGHDLQERIISLMNSREAIYKKTADHAVVTDGQTREETVENCLAVIDGAFTK